MYKMEQALELGAGSGHLRSDTKSEMHSWTASVFDACAKDVNCVNCIARADTFEAFVGAVAQVHGHDVLTKWIEDLMAPCR